MKWIVLIPNLFFFELGIVVMCCNWFTENRWMKRTTQKKTDKTCVFHPKWLVKPWKRTCLSLRKRKCLSVESQFCWLRRRRPSTSSRPKLHPGGVFLVGRPERLLLWFIWFQYRHVVEFIWNHHSFGCIGISLGSIFFWMSEKSRTWRDDGRTWSNMFPSLGWPCRGSYWCRIFWYK